MLPVETHVRYAARSSVILRAGGIQPATHDCGGAQKALVGYGFVEGELELVNLPAISRILHYARFQTDRQIKSATFGVVWRLRKFLELRIIKINTAIFVTLNQYYESRMT